ncbi:SpoIIIAH-like family protein [Bacillus sp. DTU_2020_1000418_1_SI_GHA_SEK_038]|uniref:SpoIIIAH-like family protein n=1 Tax=Bacillus sp. DTU_2020_1000418_1_SI_GHA_SEK_038 TaxID=3077585 RepID=UPI0028E48819|nr:SpoIIIAH-like family protein [Bacillus sp. DTU_2020_1000418_1_SI_GHA_SEK_038]WNS74183.1 SpoIIIAH-like family protein [Bacillus sp. DTU_2020_1000418_1_SI_GHA_SEK_038]
MLLKKQTVWLLTMLSLVVVLSVYYITSPEQNGNNLANPTEEAQQSNETAVENLDDSAIITNASGDEMFEALRLKLNDERSKMIEELTAKMANTELPAEEISAAKDQIDLLDALAKKEEMLETLIRAMNYEDVLVRAEGKNVRVTVKAKELSRSAANDIIREVNNEIGGLQAVTVEFKAPK